MPPCWPVRRIPPRAPAAASATWINEWNIHGSAAPCLAFISGCVYVCQCTSPRPTLSAWPTVFSAIWPTVITRRAPLCQVNICRRASAHSASEALSVCFCFTLCVGVDTAVHIARGQCTARWRLFALHNYRAAHVICRPTCLGGPSNWKYWSFVVLWIVKEL